MPKRRGPGRPPNVIPSALLAARIPAPLLRRFRAAARASGVNTGAFLATILERALVKESKK